MTVERSATLERGVFGCGLVLAALPWLNPFAVGPTSSVAPWMASFICGLALWSTATSLGARLRVGAFAVAAALVAWAVVGHSTPAVEVAAWAGGLMLIVLAASVADAPVLLAGALRGLLFAALASAVIALVQYFGIAAVFAPLVNHAAAGEAYANLRQPNQFATLCAMGMVLVLWDAQAMRVAGRVAIVVLLAVGSAASVSRTGLLEGAVLAALALLWRGGGRRDRILLAGVAVVSYLVASWVLPELLHAATGIDAPRTLWGRLGGAGVGCSTRVYLWSNVLALIAQHPWAGWGLGELDFAHFMTLYDQPRFCEILDNAHNLPLHLAVELGVPIALLSCVAAMAWVVGRKPWAEVQPRRQLAWAVLLVVGLHSLLEYPLWYGPFQIACGLALGILTAGFAGRTWPRALTVSVSVVLTAAVAYAAWDYARVSQIYLPAAQRAAAWRDDPLAYAQRSWLFSGQARFAALTLAVPSRDNAAQMLPEALQLLHYSPEPRVIERAIAAAVYLHRDDEAIALLARYRAAFPKEALAWSQGRGVSAQD